MAWTGSEGAEDRAHVLEHHSRLGFEVLAAQPAGGRVDRGPTREEEHVAETHSVRHQRRSAVQRCSVSVDIAIARQHVVCSADKT